ncbi:MAG TPA: stealth conserved region 3 domain-containing protein [Bdellovibrionota bacterium]|nr:stealth conserved region 3 domain-containing protein [Bdellovibrionota bacterium]
MQTKTSASDEGIDFVVLWVDGNDPSRQELLKHHIREATGTAHLTDPEGAASKKRIRDWGTFPYFFRSLEKHAPWFRKLHLITPSPLPVWLNADHPKLNIVRDEDLFADPSHLPTFNSNAVQAHLDKIPGLAEKFVLFDDDVFFLKNTPATRFFENELPVDFVCLYDRRPIKLKTFAWGHALSQTFEKVESHLGLTAERMLQLPLVHPNHDDNFNSYNQIHIEKLKSGKFEHRPSLMHLLHVPQPLLKRIVVEVNQIFAEEFARTSAARFRSPDDMLWSAYRYWHLGTNQFVPHHRYFESGYVPLSQNLEHVKKIYAQNDNPEVFFTCFNDELNSSVPEAEEERIREWLLDILQSKFPSRSSFECL